MSLLLTKPSLETASGGSPTVRSSSSSSNSRRVFRYCATVRRRTRPFFGAGRSRATSSACVIHSTICWRSALVGCGRPFGGMLPSPTLLRMDSQTGIAGPRALRRVGRPGCPPYSGRRCGIPRSSVLKNGFTIWSNDGSSAFWARPVACPSRKRAVTAIPKAKAS